MQKFKRNTLRLILIVSVCMLIWFLLLQNPKFIVQNTYYQKTYDWFAYQSTVHQDLIKVSPEQNKNLIEVYEGFIDDREMNLLKQNKILVLEPADVLKHVMEGEEVSKDVFPILVYTPHQKLGNTLLEQQKKLADVIKAAHQLQIKVVMDCSYVDRLRRMPEGFKSVLLCKQFGIRRIVVFDGGHHMASLALNPDFVLLPVTQVEDHTQYVNHAFMRDAMPVDKVQECIKHLSLDTVMMEAGRIRTMAKSKNTMGELARQIIVAGAKAIQQVSVPTGEYEMGITYPLEAVQANDQVVITPQQTALVYINPSGTQETERIIKKIEQQVADIVNKHHAVKRVYLAIHYGDSTLKSLKKDIPDPIVIHKAIEKMIQKYDLNIDVVNIAYSGWDLYWQKIIRFAKQKKDLARQILSLSFDL